MSDRALLLIAAIVIDILIGDPVYPLHPVRLMGNLISFLEKALRKVGLNGIGGGCLLLIFTLTIPVSIYLIIEQLLSDTVGLILFQLFIYYSLVSITDLNRHATRVFQALKDKDLKLARERLSWIVGRNTEKLKESQVCQACVETIAESSSDGIIAPLFWGLLLGPAGMIGYKVVNTLDSMVGYKNEKYLLFGRCSAKADDVLNFIPARITMLLLLIQKRVGPQQLVTAFRDRLKHSSPNAGHPETAMAVLLNIKMGGPSTYGTMLVEKPWINSEGKAAKKEHIKAAQKHIYILAVELIFILLFIATL